MAEHLMGLNQTSPLLAPVSLATLLSPSLPGLENPWEAGWLRVNSSARSLWGRKKKHFQRHLNGM